MTMPSRPNTQNCTRLLTIGFLTTLLMLVLTIGFIPQAASASTEAEKNTCIECHGDKKFLVQNKKLYDYFEQWETSVHFEEDVSCEECHGGNARASMKVDSHGTGVSAQDEASGIYFKNVTETCGECHGEILDGFKKSEHFEHVVAKKQEDQGPTCVTCHGSINVEILDVNSVAASCARCHNEESDNHPGNPEEAKRVINRFLSISRYYRYLSHRIDPSESQAFFKDLDEKLDELSITWHTFDLKKIDTDTKAVLDHLKAKREEIRKESKAAESK